MLSREKLLNLSENHQALTPEEFETSDGARLCFVDVGEGRPIIFVHGWAATRRFWGWTIARLSPKTRKIALDLRGHGDSDKDDDLDYSACRMVKDVLEMVEALGIRRPLLVGHSLGGLVAALCSYEIDASGLVLTGIMRKVGAPILRLKILMKMRWLAERLVTPRMFAPGADEELLDFVRGESAKSPAGILVEVMRQTAGSELPTHARISHIPLLVIAGNLDTLVPSSGQELLAGELGGIYRTIEGAGHNLMLEKPGEFAKLIEEFYRQITL